LYIKNAWIFKLKEYQSFFSWTVEIRYLYLELNLNKNKYSSIHEKKNTEVKFLLKVAK